MQQSLDDAARTASGLTMWSFIASLFTGGLNAILGTIGKTVTDIHTSNTARQGSENQSGVTVHGQYVEGHSAAGAQRAQQRQQHGYHNAPGAKLILRSFRDACAHCALFLDRRIDCCLRPELQEACQLGAGGGGNLGAGRTLPGSVARRIDIIRTEPFHPDLEVTRQAS